jgi:AraC family transcriptional regulator of adaptative response/methylated-DNA-[protein]-cysteine methyltransferase
MTTRTRKAIAMSETIVNAVREAAAYIERRSEEEADGPVSLKELGDHTGVSPWHLQRQFKRVLGVSPRQYDDALRMKRLRRGVKSGGGVAGATLFFSSACFAFARFNRSSIWSSTPSGAFGPRIVL